MRSNSQIIAQTNSSIERNLNNQTTKGPRLHISVKELHTQAKRFSKGFKGIVSYAVKANSNHNVIWQLHQGGIRTFDVASIPEMALVSNIAPKAILHYHNPVRSVEEIDCALYKFGCRRFAVDHVDELRKLAARISNHHSVEIAVRFRDNHQTQAVQSFKSKFGATELEAVQLLKLGKTMGFQMGLSFHPGSQTLSPLPYVQHIETAARISHEAGIDLNFLNVGGGFPAKYDHLEFPPLEHFFNEISSSAQNEFQNKLPLLECEPGRALTASSGTLYTTIKSIRDNRNELFLNDGIYGALMEVYQFPALQPYHCLSDGGSQSAATIEWTAFGPTCDPIDVLPFKLTLPRLLHEGQEIQFRGLGAYTNATATRFNGYGCIQVILDD